LVHECFKPVLECILSVMGSYVFCESPGECRSVSAVNPVEEGVPTEDDKGGDSLNIKRLRNVRSSLSFYL